MYKEDENDINEMIGLMSLKQEEFESYNAEDITKETLEQLIKIINKRQSEIIELKGK